MAQEAEIIDALKKIERVEKELVAYAKIKGVNLTYASIHLGGMKTRLHISLQAGVAHANGVTTDRIFKPRSHGPAVSRDYAWSIADARATIDNAAEFIKTKEKKRR